MTDGSFSVQHSAFDAMGDTLAAETARIRGYLDELQTNLQPLMSTWDGVARDAYQTAQANWNAACADMEGTLQSAYVASQEIHNQYIRADNSGANQFGG